MIPQLHITLPPTAINKLKHIFKHVFAVENY